MIELWMLYKKSVYSRTQQRDVFLRSRITTTQSLRLRTEEKNTIQLRL